MPVAVPDSALDLAGSTSAAGPLTLGGPLTGLDAANLARFQAGLEEFADEDTPEQGLGPVFNEASCEARGGRTRGGSGQRRTRFATLPSPGHQHLGLGDVVPLAQDREVDAGRGEPPARHRDLVATDSEGSDLE
jgi:hypothetical protein